MQFTSQRGLLLRCTFENADDLTPEMHFSCIHFADHGVEETKGNDNDNDKDVADKASSKFLCPVFCTVVVPL